jgi:single-strand DNA-binding protein
MINNLHLVGNLGGDAESKALESGFSVVEFSVATSTSYKKKDSDEWEQQTQWHRVTAWGKTADIIERFVTKGKEIAIEGKLTHRSYDDKDGNKRYVTEVLANEILLISK